MKITTQYIQCAIQMMVTVTEIPTQKVWADWFIRAVQGILSLCIL